MPALTRRPKPQRTLKVLSAVTSRVIVIEVTEGKRVDGYTVAAADGAYWWSHTDNPDRRYRVDCGPSGPTSCDCPSRIPCRHLLGSITLVARGLIGLPEIDTSGPDETVRDVAAEAEAADGWADEWEAHRGPDRPADDAHADAIGRRIVTELGGC